MVRGDKLILIGHELKKKWGQRRILGSGNVWERLEMSVIKAVAY